MKAREISWKKSISSRKCFGNVVEEWIAFASKVLLDVICALIFTNAARVMLVDVFGWAKLSPGNLLKIIIFAVLISFLMELADYMPKRRRSLLKIGILPVAIGICIEIIKIGGQATHLLPGLQKMASYYIEYWNLYYDSTFFYAAGRTKYIVEALDFCTMFLFIVLFWMAKAFKKNLIMAVLPSLVLVAELMVGYAPAYKGLMLFFVAVLLANTFKWTAPDFASAPGRKFVVLKSIKSFSWISICVMVVFACGVIKTAGTETAEKLVANSTGIKTLVKETAAKMEEFSIEWLPIAGKDKNGGISETAILTNEAQRYKHNVVLQIEFGEMPVGKIYLKGFSADTYQDGKWSVNVDSFDKACKKAGFDNRDMSNYILSLGVRKLYDTYRVTELIETEYSNKATIKYLAEEDKKVYLPYFIELKDKGLTSEGSALYRKNEKQDEVSFELWDYEGDYRSYLTFSQEGADSDWEKWYREYVLDHYYEVPDNLPSVVRIAEALEQELQVDYSIQYKKNEQRLKKAELVVQWMRANTEYSTDLPEIPKEMDPVEYFLGTSRNGYCMHYASASVMILRQMGVPARYASGYIVKPGSVKEYETGFYANVKDSNAHAWVEIYLDDIGWVPIEVTKGYSRTTIGDQGTEDVTQNPQFTTSVALETAAPNEDEATDDAVEDKEKTDEDDKLQNGDTVGDENDADSGEENVGFKIVIGCIAAGIIGLIVVIFYSNATYRKRLLDALHRKHTLRAIKMINRRIYKRLRYMGKIRKANLRDNEYKEILIETYTDILALDWERYMDIVKAAAFSNRVFSVEEMEFCYKLYRKIAEENRKKNHTRRN